MSIYKDIANRHSDNDTYTKNDSRETFGDTLSKRQLRDKIKIVFQNINGFGADGSTEKRELIYKFLKTYKIDVFSMAEVNTNWKLVGKKNTLSSIVTPWFENVRSIAAHNLVTSTKKAYQPGGVAMITTGDIAIRTMKQDFDSRRLGRWCSSLIRGKNNIKIRLVTIYVPQSSRSEGAKTVYAQQQASLLKQKCTRGVIPTFWNDFWQEIDQWLTQGEQLIVCGDWNQNIKINGDLSKEFKGRNMIPAITSRHQNAPETYNGGSVPIDEIYVSQTLNITSSGYLEHGINNSDHRPIWVEITKESAIGMRPPKITTIKARRLKTGDPKIVNKYNYFLQRELEKNKVYEKALCLYKNHHSPMTKEECIEYDALDRMRERAMKKAEKKCRKLYTGNVQWSPTIQLLRDKILYLNLSIRRKKGRKVGARYLLRLSKKVGYSCEYQKIHEIEKKLTETYKVYTKQKKIDKTLRLTYLENIAKALEEEGNGKKKKIIENLIHREQSKKQWKRLATLKSKYGENLSTTGVTITHEDGRTEDITSKKEIERAIIKENEKKYHQCETTCPFLSKTMKKDFGEYGEGKATQQVLEGKYICKNNNNPLTQTFIDCCKKDNEIRVEKDAFTRTPQKFKQSWKKMKEKTSSHDLHFGHFKAACKNTKNILLHYVMAELPFITGYSPSRWKTATNVMILKKSGLYNLEKLRTLCLFQADFNHNNKFLGKETMSTALDNSKVSIETYSIPGKRSIHQVLNRTLLFDKIRYQKCTVAMTSCDLKSCYDRIVHTPVMLALQSVGVPKEPLISMFESIQNTQFYTRTAYGLSKSTFGGKKKGYTSRPQGTGQGNGCAPQIWVIVSSKMFEMMKAQGFGNKITCPITGTVINIIGFAYVDDTDLFTINMDNNVKETLNTLQKLIDTWEQAAKVTGGALEPLKSWWYLVSFKWDKGLWTYCNKEDIADFELKTKDKNDVEQKLQYLEVNSAEEMLGVFIAPDGNNDAQIKKMTDKAVEYGEMVRAGYLQRHEVWIGLTHMTMKALEYPLPAISLTEQECDKIMWNALKQFLPRSGINRHIKRDVLYSPIEIQGFGLNNLYLTQGISHVCEIIAHLWQETTTGHFIKSTLEHLRMEIGVNCSILESNYDYYKDIILTKSWIQSTWQFMSNNGIKLKDGTAIIAVDREGDIPLMDLVLATNKLTNLEKHTFNRCRMYLQVFTISDICTADGKRITNKTWHGRRQTDNVRRLQWPTWERPTLQSWTTWRKVLKEILCPFQVQMLEKPLGNWTHAPTYWNWYIDLNDNLYYNKGEQWRIHKKIGGTPRRRRYSTEGYNIRKVENNLRLTSVRLAYGYYYIEGSSIINQTKTHIVDTIVMQQNKWLEGCVKEPENIEQIIQSFQKGEIIAVTDGSYMDNHKIGTAAWIITNNEETVKVEGRCHTPGIDSQINAFRSEAVGVTSILNWVNNICKHKQIHEGKMVIACDCKSVVTIMEDWTIERMNPNQDNADILSLLLKLRNNIPLTIKMTHVKAHQEEKKSKNKLTQLEKLNIKMDKAAKATALAAIHNKKERIYSFEHKYSFKQCEINGEVITSTLKTTLYNKIMTKKIEKYWIEKGRIKETHTQLYDKEVLGKAMKSMTSNIQRFASKWSCETLATGKNMTRWNQRFNSKCPFCNHDKEDTNHILKCKSEESIQIWKEMIDNMLVQLQKADTCWLVMMAIKKELNNWKRDKKHDALSKYPLLLQEAIEEQRQLGWKNFLEGLISRKWTEYMKQYYVQSNTKKSAVKWASKLVKYTWMGIHYIWKERNKKIHDTQIIQDLQGLPHLIDSIKRELAIGIGRLPATEFSRQFGSRSDRILQATVEQQLNWMQIVRQGRILLDPDNLIEDEISKSKSLQRWIGIDYEIKDEEGKELLHKAIQHEIEIGVEELYKNTNIEIEDDKEKIYKLGLREQKQWLEKIRELRKRYDETNLEEDEFMHKGAYRNWLMEN